MSELETGTVKTGTTGQIIKEITSLRKQNKALRDELEEARERLGVQGKVLNRIVNAKECDVCKCKQVMGKTYDGLMFVHLQTIARKALK